MDQTGSFTCLDDWLPWLETLSPREIDLGLDRVVTVLGRLDLPRAERVIIVAGTNGKGSSVAMLDALLADAGYRTACYTSPHLLRYNERIRIDGLAATDAEIITAFERVQSARQDVPLTYFEFGTVAALVAFAESAADTLILEVGMGAAWTQSMLLNPMSASSRTSRSTIPTGSATTSSRSRQKKPGSCAHRSRSFSVP